MDKQLRRILNLVRKTGDRMVVTDTNGEDIYVVMGLDQYETLVEAAPSSSGCDGDCGGACHDQDDDIPSFEENSDVFAGTAQIPADPGDAPFVPPASIVPSPSDIWEAMQPAGSEGETWDLGKMSDGEKADLQKQFEEYQRTKEEEGKKNLESKAADDDEFGEEQFYLEPVE